MRANKTVANKENAALLRYASRKSNLAVKDVLCDHENKHRKNHTLIGDLEKPLQRAKLVEVTDFLPVIQNFTS